MMLRRLTGMLLVAGLAGCASTSPTSEDRRLSYRDGSEYFWPTTRGLVSRSAAPTGVTYYFQVDSKRVCWAFEVPGTWQLGREAALLRRIDGKGVAGVWLFGLRDIGATSMEDAILKAAAQSDQQFARHLPGAARSTLTPYPRVPGAWQWTLPPRTEESGRIVMAPPRWYLPVGDAWLAQFTLAVPPDVDADTFVGGILQSLTTSREARCYEARMRELGALR